MEKFKIIENPLCHLCGKREGRREHYLFDYEELDEQRARTIGKYRYVRTLDDLIRNENGAEELRNFIKITRMGMFGWLEDEAEEVTDLQIESEMDGFIYLYYIMNT